MVKCMCLKWLFPIYIEVSMLLHVILADDNIQRVRTEGLPETVDELKMMLKTRLNLEGEMVIKFQDEELGGQFCNLNNMEDLPSERIKLKVIMKVPPSSPQSDYTLDTELGHIQSILR